MDEPLCNLDAKLRVRCAPTSRACTRSLGTTTVYVTHDQTEAMTMGDRVAVMRDGRLAQCAAPQTLYDAPADLFVAGFMGSPRDEPPRGAARRADGGAMDVVVGRQRLQLPGTVLDRRPALRAYAGRDVVVGLRPEATAQSPNGPVAGHTLELDVLLTESLGSDVLVHAEADGTALLLRLEPGTSARAGGTVRAVVDVERLHFFDPETELAIR